MPSRIRRRAAQACAAASVLAALIVTIPASSAGSSLPGCTTAQLRISLGQFNGGVGHGGYPILFKDLGASCTLRGYPGVDGLSASGATVVHAKRTLFGYLGGTRTITTVTLTHGKSASALLEGLNASAPGQPCHRFQKLEITPPNATTSVKLPAFSICYPEIHPVVRTLDGISGA
jgi:hypothetical protein